MKTEGRNTEGNASDSDTESEYSEQYPRNEDSDGVP